MKSELTTTTAEAIAFLDELPQHFAWRRGSIEPEALNELLLQKSGSRGIARADAGQESVNRLLACGYDFSTGLFEMVEVDPPAPVLSGGQGSEEPSFHGGCAAQQNESFQIREVINGNAMAEKECEEAVQGSHPTTEVKNTNPASKN